MKRILVLILLISLCALVLAGAQAETVKLAYKGGSLNLRTGPGTQYGNNGYVYNGDYITVLETGSVWSKVLTSDMRVGYIKNLYISGNGSKYADGTVYYSGKYSGTVSTKYADSKVNLRAGASSSAAKITSLKNGTKVSVLGKNGSWYLISTSAGTQGFMHEKYIKSSAASAVSARVTGSAVNMRAYPNASSARVTTLIKGTVVKVLDTSNAKWWFVQYSSYTGFMYSAYLKKL